MEKLEKKIAFIILNAINSSESYGFEILSAIKDRNEGINETMLYSTIKVLEHLQYITTFKKIEDGNCCVKIRYLLTEKGHDFINRNMSND